MTINNNNITYYYRFHTAFLSYNSMKSYTPPQNFYDNIIPIAIRGYHVFESFYYSLLHLLGFKLSALLTYITGK